MSISKFVLTLVLLAGMRAGAANLVLNGGFEDPACLIQVCAFASPTNWTVVSGNVDIVSNQLWFPQEGNQSLDLNGSDAGAIAQTFNTVLGATYQAAFYLAGNSNGVPTIKQLTASAAGQSQQFSFNVSTTNNINMGWSLQTFQFVASGSSTTLQFASNTSGSYGPTLDNVSVELIAGPQAPPPPGVPEPASVLLFGPAVAALSLARRRRA